METSTRVPPVLATVRFNRAMNIPGARRPTLAASLFLPGTIGEFFGDDGGAYRHDFMDEAAMQTLAMGGEFPLTGGLTSPDGEIPLAVFPFQALLPALLDAS